MVCFFNLVLLLLLLPYYKQQIIHGPLLRNVGCRQVGSGRPCKTFRCRWFVEARKDDCRGTLPIVFHPPSRFIVSSSPLHVLYHSILPQNHNYPTICS